MKNNLRLITILSLLTFTLTTITGCGSAEAIKSYNYATSKDNLEMAIQKVIKDDLNIYQDTITDRKLDSIHLKDKHIWTETDSIYYYDDLGAYVRIKIKTMNKDFDYVLRYSGGKQEWKNSNNSVIFISEIHDQKGNVISQGHNEKGQFKSKMALEAIELLETELINKVNQQLNTKISG